MKFGELFVDDVMVLLLDDVKHRVLKLDNDWVCCVDGEEGSGKSVLAMQLAKYLDPDFNINNVVFNADAFIKIIKDPNTKKGAAIILDEAFNAANARASLTEVNRSMVALATEMRQKNLFILIVLPSFFDLDRYFALWRCRALIHVYFDEKGARGQYIIFPKEQKKILYLVGRKTYNYAKPHSPYPPCRFNSHYVVNEEEYREKKAEAFKRRTVSMMAKRWMAQRDSYIKFLIKNYGITQDEVAKIPTFFGVEAVNQTIISRIMSEFQENPDT